MDYEIVYGLLRLGNGVGERFEKLDNRLKRIATYAFGDTDKQLCAMMNVIDEKRKLVKAVYYRDNMLRGLTREEVQLLYSRAKGVSSEKQKGEMGYSGRSVRRKIRQAERTASNILYLLGCDGKTAKECCDVCFA